MIHTYRVYLVIVLSSFFGAGMLAKAGEAGPAQPEATAVEFTREIQRALPPEQPFDYHKHLAGGPVHVSRRAPDATPAEGEFLIPASGWKLVVRSNASQLLQDAARDFQNYLAISLNTQAPIEPVDDLTDWQNSAHTIVVGTQEHLPGIGTALAGPKDYEIMATPSRIVVCGYDDRGAMYGLYHLEERMNLREAPILPANLHTVRHSLYDVRMVQSWLGWMEYPDALLAHLAHDGFDAVFASVYANPNGDRTTAENSTDFYARLMHRMRHQDPARVRDLIDRAARYGIKVYTQIIYQYTGTPESEADLRRLVRDILGEFPDIAGFVLLTEGFWYKQWGGGHGADRAYMEDWAQNWARAVGIVAEECHRVNPAIEILPWEYNIDFRPQNADMKKYFIQQLPEGTTPLLTWENGKSFEMDGLTGYLRDYAISQVGPAEVTAAQIAEARKRGMRVYSNAQTFVCGAQLQTIPYHPFPYQWYERYEAMDKLHIDGTLESWSTGYTPNFMTELRAWYCWTDAPAVDELLGMIAARDFGVEQKGNVLKAWKLFSQAIRTLPDTGPYMGTGNATGNPIFFRQPPARTVTFTKSWTDQNYWMGYLGAEINPYWPFTVSRMVFVPDFSNQSNAAEGYARAVSGVEAAPDITVLPVFLKYLKQTVDGFDEGLALYRTAALKSSPGKRAHALHEVIIAEQIHRMLASDYAILHFEDLRLQFARENTPEKLSALVEQMEHILREEIARTELSLLAVSRDSRLGFQFETDYVFTPYSLNEKLKELRDALEKDLPEFYAMKNGRAKPGE